MYQKTVREERMLKIEKKIHCLSSQLSSSMSNNLHEIIVLKKRGNTLAQLSKVKSASEPLQSLPLRV